MTGGQLSHIITPMRAGNTDRIIGARFKKLRESRGIRQNFIAKRLGIRNTYLSDLEAGKKRWFASLVLKYEKVLGI